VNEPSRDNRNDATKGAVLIAAVALALVLANSPIAHAFAPVWSGPVHFWVNHGLMSLFFLQVGLEIKREVLVGELGTRKRASLPLAAAVGGMLVPAACYLAVASSYAVGWGVPASTDTAFAIGILGIVGRRAPARLRILLTGFAILDDIGAVLIVALFYSHGFSPLAFACVAVGLAGLAMLNRRGVRHLGPYLLVGAFVWAAMVRSGVHATISGILVAMTIPADGTPSPLGRLEDALEPVVTLAVLPVFAFCNAGIAISSDLLAVARHPTTLGILFGLVVGKPIGVFGASFAAVKLGWAELPAGTGWRDILGTAVLAGIGFTMSIFIATIAFGDDPNVSLDDAKLAVLAASFVSALAGAALLWRAPQRAPRRQRAGQPLSTTTR
jgi:NhaA family Na+:H+ antiporter